MKFPYLPLFVFMKVHSISLKTMSSRSIFEDFFSIRGKNKKD